MTVDWFTLVAQLLNFALLLVLLRVFLYRPILNVMQQRDAAITSARREVDDLREAASADAEELRRERAAIEAERRARLTEAEREAADLRETLRAEAEREAGELRASLAKALERDQARVLEALRRRTTTLILDELRETLSALADTSLEHQSVTAFRRRLEALDEPRRAALRDAAKGGDATVTTAFALDDGQRSELREAVRDLLGIEDRVTFASDERLLFGTILTVGGVRVDGSASGHLHALEDAFTAALRDLQGVGSTAVSPTVTEDASP